MTSRTSLAAAATLLTLTLSACGQSSGADTAADPAADPATPSATPTPTGPSTAPKPGSLPDFPYADYAYTLEQRCFCANIHQKYRIVVRGGNVTEVTWATPGEGHAVGDAVPGDLQVALTIQDIIDLGNDRRAAEVEVDWPSGQLYPTSVYVDRDKTIADEEGAWVVSDVQPA